MSDKAIGTQFAGVGTPQNVPPAAQPEQQQQVEQQTAETEKPLTRAELLEIVRTEIRNSNNSFSDKIANRITRKLEQLQAAGITATPAQAEKLVQAEVDETKSNPEPDHPKQKSAQTQAGGGEQAQDPVKEAAGILIAAGIDPKNWASHPDSVLVDQETEDPDVFIASVKRFAKAAQARGNPARVAATGSGGGASAGGKAGLLTQLQAALKEPTKNMAEIQRIRAELKKYS